MLAVHTEHSAGQKHGSFLALPVTPSVIFFWQGLDNQFSNLNSGLAKNSAWVSPKPICETNGWKLGIHYFKNSAELIRWTCVMGGTEGWSEWSCFLLGQCGGKMILFHNTSCSLRFQLCKSIITGTFSYKTKYLAPGPPGRQTVCNSNQN